MKTTIKILFAATLLCVLAACKKSDVPSASTVASLNLLNATVGASPIIVQFNNKSVFFSTITSSNELSYGSSVILSPVGGNIPTALTQSTDTVHTVFKGNLNLQNFNIYSFFLAGNTAQPDTMLVHDQLTYYAPTDSVGGVRFVNLSTGSSPVSVDIQGQPNGSEVQNLPYKNITAFNTYSATHANSSYVFEFRNASSGTLIASYTISGVNNSTGVNTSSNTFRFKNHTLALIGQPGGTGAAAQKIILMNNY